MATKTNSSQTQDTAVPRSDILSLLARLIAAEYSAASLPSGGRE